MKLIAQIYIFIIRIAILLALTGQLKSCTLVMMNKAAQKTEAGVISYSKFTRLLTK